MCQNPCVCSSTYIFFFWWGGFTFGFQHVCKVDGVQVSEMRPVLRPGAVWSYLPVSNPLEGKLLNENCNQFFWGCDHSLYILPIILQQKKSRIRETSDLSTDADRRTDTILEKLRDLSKKKKKKNKKIRGCLICLKKINEK